MAEVEHELAKCHANLPAIVGDQLHKSWIFSVVVGVAKKKNPFQLYVVLSLKAEAFFVCVSAVEESHVTFDWYLLLKVTLC